MSVVCLRAASLGEGLSTGIDGVDEDTLALGKGDPRLGALANDEDVRLAVIEKKMRKQV